MASSFSSTQLPRGACFLVAASTFAHYLVEDAWKLRCRCSACKSLQLRCIPFLSMLKGVSSTRGMLREDSQLLQYEGTRQSVRVQKHLAGQETTAVESSPAAEMLFIRCCSKKMEKKQC